MFQHKNTIQSSVAFFALASVVLYLLALRPQVEARFLPPIQKTEAINPQISFSQHDLKAGTASAHSASIVVHPKGNKGERLAYWFAGKREGAHDVKIYSAHFANGQWAPARPVASPLQSMRDQWRFIRKVGNPVAVVDQANRLHLFYVSVSVGGWATSQINQMTSLDGGESFGPAKVLVTSPFINISTLIRTAAVQRADGGFDLPAYHELAHKFPELLRFSATGDFVEKRRMHNTGRALQPAIVAINEQSALTLQRDAGPLAKIIYQATLDGGRHWDFLQNINVDNPNSALALARFPDGELLMAYNPRLDGRSELALATSLDGKTWTKQRSVELEVGGEFSYPTLLIDDGNIDLIYTWQRKHIRHLRFGREWMKKGTGQ